MNFMENHTLTFDGKLKEINEDFAINNIRNSDSVFIYGILNTKKQDKTMIYLVLDLKIHI